MSIESVSQGGGLPAVSARDPQFATALEHARRINARPGIPENDRYFVYEVLGPDIEKASKKHKELVKLLYARTGTHPGATPDENAACEQAMQRLNICWKAARVAKTVEKPGAFELARPSAGVASVIIVAAQVADRGLAMADQGLRAAREAWQRKVDDGTVGAVKERVRAGATDLFDLGRSFAQRGWAEAIRRTRGDKS